MIEFVIETFQLGKVAASNAHRKPIRALLYEVMEVLGDALPSEAGGSEHDNVEVLLADHWVRFGEKLVWRLIDLQQEQHSFRFCFQASRFHEKQDFVSGNFSTGPKKRAEQSAISKPVF